MEVTTTKITVSHTLQVSRRELRLIELGVGLIHDMTNVYPRDEEAAYATVRNSLVDGNSDVLEALEAKTLADLREEAFDLWDEITRATRED